jgi:hypothetical protein
MSDLQKCIRHCLSAHIAQDKQKDVLFTCAYFLQKTGTKHLNFTPYESLTLESEKNERMEIYSHFTDNSFDVGPVIPYPNAILSLDPGQVNIGLCCVKLENAIDVIPMDHPFDQLACINDYFLDIQLNECPSYVIDKWAILQSRETYKEPKAIIKKKAKSSAAAAVENKPKTHSKSIEELALDVSSYVTNVIVAKNVSLVIVEKQVDAALQNRMIQLAISVATNTCGNFSTIQLLTLHALGKFDFHSSYLQMVREKIRRSVMSRNPNQDMTHSQRKEWARKIVIHIIHSASSQESDDDVDDEFTKLQVPFISRTSLASFQKEFSKSEKLDDMADTLLQIVSQLHSIIYNIVARNRIRQAILFHKQEWRRLVVNKAGQNVV